MQATARFFWWWGVALLTWGTLVVTAPASADTLVATEFQITATADTFETTPRLGNDGISDLVVFVKRDLLSVGHLGLGDVFYQRLEEGAPVGAAVRIDPSDVRDDQLADISGDYIVYTSYDDLTSSAGSIMLYQISTGTTHTIASATVIEEPKIHGRRIVWREGGAFAAEVMYFEIGWIDPGYPPLRLAGPVPPTFDVQMGSRYAVWAELDGTYDVYAYDFNFMTTVRVTNTPAINERQPATSGDWIVWQQQAGTTVTTEARNMVTAERVTIDNGAGNYNPSIDDDLIGWESTVAGNLDIWVHRLSVGESYAVTTDPDDQYLNDVFHSMVAYVLGSVNPVTDEDIYVSTLEFFSERPVADAGVDQSVYVGDLVTLDGSASFDPDEDYPLTFAWALIDKPAGSTATLAGADTEGASFTADRAGTYTAELVVTDSEGDSSAPDQVVISTINTAPVADAGEDQSITLIGTVVQLDGSQSYDDDGDEITYAWTLSRPAGSTAVLDYPTSATPSFTADVNGDYTATLVVSDGVLNAEDMVLVTFDNVAPVADAGNNQTVGVGDTVALDGTGSSDANGDPLTYLWSLVSAPPGSSAVIQPDNAATTSFVPDESGSYVISLVVNDGLVNSEPSSVTITATATSEQVIEDLKDAVETINDLHVSVFKNKNHQKNMSKHVGQAVEMIDEGDYEGALNKLEAVLRKTDGCAMTGAPDPNDWIRNCAAQAEVYPLIVDAIALIDVILGG